MARAKKTQAKRPSVADTWMEIARQRGMTAQPAAATKSGKELWKLLEDPLAPVRQAAGFALASVRDPSIVQAFILALKGADSRRMARSAVTLGAAGFVNAAPYLAAGFSRHDKKLSAAIARALGLLADRSAAPLLMQALDDDFVPTEAAEALGQLGDVRAAPALVRALSHKNDSVRAAAAYALGSLGELAPEDETVSQQRLAALGGDKSRRVRICAAVARYERGDAEGLTAIRAALG